MKLDSLNNVCFILLTLAIRGNSQLPEEYEVCAKKRNATFLSSSKCKPIKDGCLISRCTQRPSIVSHILPPSLDEYLSAPHIRCGMCLTVAKIVNDTFTEAFKFRQTRDQENQILEEACNNKFIDYTLRSIGATKFIGDDKKRSISVKTVADRKWPRKLTELCRFYEHFYDRRRQYTLWFLKDTDVFHYLCKGGGIFRDCQGLIELPQFFNCPPGDTLCVFRQVKWLLPHAGTMFRETKYSTKSTTAFTNPLPESSKSEHMSKYETGPVNNNINPNPSDDTLIYPVNGPSGSEVTKEPSEPKDKTKVTEQPSESKITEEPSGIKVEEGTSGAKVTGELSVTESLEGADITVSPSETEDVD